MLKYSYPQEVFQEIPGEISLALSISGCPLACKNCHSSETWNKNFGKELNINEIDLLLKRFKHVSCVLFYGGEWEINKLIEIIDYIKEKYNLLIGLYSGNELSFFSNEFLKKIDFLKTGMYIESKGNLTSKYTNQKFFILKKGIIEKEILFYK